jgi:hypothetical protein
MLRWLLQKPIDAFERTYHYDMSYAREILAASPRALLRFARIGGFVEHHEDVPLEALFAAKLAGTMGEDCGPCTQLMVDMAERRGVSSAALRAILTRDPARMPADAALAWRFAQASLDHDLAADPLREEVRQRWGDKALVSLAFALAGARIFPTLKYALGHGRSCARVRVGGDEMAVAARV